MEEEPNKEEPGKEPEPEKTSDSEKASGPEKEPEAKEKPEAEKEREALREPEAEEETEAPETAGVGEEPFERSEEETAGRETTGGEQHYQVPPPAGEAPYSGAYHQKRLRKSRTNRILFGVCGGLGEYLNIDPVIIRLIFILSFLLGGWGFLIYIIAAIIMPGSPRTEAAPESEERISSENSKIILGSALILLGLYALLRTTGFLHFFSFFGITHEFIIPLILIVLGIILLTKHREFIYREAPSQKKLTRSSTNRMIAGVCAGLGNYLNIDPTLIRIIWVILTFGSFGIGILIYILFALLVPLDNEVNLEK